MVQDDNSPDLWLDRDAAAEAIRNMKEDDLRYLNVQIIERLKLIAQARSTVEMSRFSIGQRVCFVDHGGQTQQGQIIRLNKKTMSIATSGGQRWNVSPALVRLPPDTKGP
ncbi:MAG: hypothetical protein ACE37H_07975 [Phycisphaeraceae bacterium]